MHWADRIAKEIIESGNYEPYWVDDMFTPSGWAHLGSLRGPLVHDGVYRALQSQDKDVTFTFVFNDFDPLDGLPDNLAQQFGPHLGFPLRVVPSPEPGFDSFADYFAHDFKNVLGELGVTPRFLSSWDMYHEGKFDGVIRQALDQAQDIQDVYERVSGSKKRQQGWLPLQVICPHCGKLGPTRVYQWDGREVGYKCEPQMVSWAQGCGQQGRISPFGGNGKLPWKVDWPAHWKVLGVTIEGAGKDHASRGGSRDIARELCKVVFEYSEPYNFAYEFFLLGGKKMASSKGIGLGARELHGILPDPVARFLFMRTDYRQTIEFDPYGTMAIPDLFDEYDRAWRAYNSDGDQDLARTFTLSQIEGLPPKQAELFIPRFRDVANYLTVAPDAVGTKFEEAKGAPLTKQEQVIVGERQHYAEIWLRQYAPSKQQFHITGEFVPEKIQLSDADRAFLNGVARLVEQELGVDELQQQLYSLAKDLHLDSKQAFATVYQVLIGKEHGPKAAVLLQQYPKDQIIHRLRQAAGQGSDSNK